MDIFYKNGKELLKIYQKYFFEILFILMISVVTGYNFIVIIDCFLLKEYVLGSAMAIYSLFLLFFLIGILKINRHIKKNSLSFTKKHK